jgi:hypothetical protein
MLFLILFSLNFYVPTVHLNWAASLTTPTIEIKPR